MLNIEIPNTNNGRAWTRKQFEIWIRENILKKGHSTLIKFSQRFGLIGDYSCVVPSLILIHFVLDRIIKENKGHESIQVEGELIGLCSNKLNKGDVPQYKIKGLDSPREDITEFMNEFTDKIAHFIIHEWACMPNEGEGVDLDRIQDIIGNRGTPNYLPLPSSVMPIHPVIKEIRDPSKGIRVKRVVEQELDNLNSDMDILKERLSKHDNEIHSLDKRLYVLEELVKDRRK